MISLFESIFNYSISKSLKGANIKLESPIDLLNDGRQYTYTSDGGYPWIKCSYNKGQARALQSVELHSRHNGHGIHLQGNKWNIQAGKRSGALFRWRI